MPQEIIATASEATIHGTEPLTFTGTYVAQRNYIPKNSYVLANDGKWYYTSNVYSVQGFRAWIQTTGGSVSGKLTFAIDGVNEGLATDISGLYTESSTHNNGAVYNLSGQVVRANGDTTDLPKGIYIKGGKKFVVK